MDQVHVVRHKVLVDGQSVRRVAREMELSRNTVKRYLEMAAPVRVEHAEDRLVDLEAACNEALHEVIPPLQN